MIEKYKLLKNLPGIKAGQIFASHGVDYKDELYYFIGDITISEKVIKNNPDWFAPYIFTMDCGKDLFVGDEFYYIGDALNICLTKCLFKGDGRFDKTETFSSKESAQKYLESLKPKFKVGDIVSNSKGFIFKIDAIVGRNLYVTNIIYADIEDCYAATNTEIISYYSDLGWVKGAKFKYGQYEDIVNYIKIVDEKVVVYTTKTPITWILLSECELIKDEYPKSWEELHYIEGYYIHNCSDIRKAESDFKVNYTNRNTFATIKQADSARAFAQLTQLHKRFIEVYNKENNCNWKPDWSNNEDKWIIILVTNCTKPYLSVRANTNTFYHLAFPTEFLAIIFLDYHRLLLEQYFEL